MKHSGDSSQQLTILNEQLREKDRLVFRSRWMADQKALSAKSWNCQKTSRFFFFKPSGFFFFFSKKFQNLTTYSRKKYPFKIANLAESRNCPNLGDFFFSDHLHFYLKKFFQNCKYFKISNLTPCKNYSLEWIFFQKVHISTTYKNY